MKYTEKIHAKRLLGMLKKKDPCTCCPGASHYDWNVAAVSDTACKVCQSFIGVRVTVTCPCLKLGRKEALKRTWIALEEKGYI